MKKRYLSIVGVLAVVGIVVLTQKRAQIPLEVLEEKSPDNFVAHTIKMQSAGVKTTNVSAVAPEDSIQAAHTRYEALRQKTLMSKAETQEYLDVIAKPELALAAAEVITNENELSFSPQGEEKRIKAIDFLKKALEHPDSYVSKETATLIATLVQEIKVTSDMPIELRRSKTGDKVELFRLLTHYAPAYARSVAAAATDAKDREIYAFAQAVHAHAKAE